MHVDRDTKDKDTAKEKRPSPVNLFIFGAGQGRISKKGKSIISQFCEYCSDQQHTLVYDGIGSKSKAGKKLRVLLGFFSSDADNMIKKAIKDIAQLKPIPKEINLMGFSIGAVEAIQLGAKLNQHFPEIKIRMLLIDPIAGPTQKRKAKNREIHGNVKECIVMLSKDETRRYMSVQDPIARLKIVEPEKTSFHALPLPGVHDECDYEYKDSISNVVPQAAWQIVYQFFKKGGTEFKGDKIPPMIRRTAEDTWQEMELKEKSPSQRLTDYDLMRLHSDEFELTASGPFRKKRSFVRELEYFVADGFMNQDERELCKLCYPSAFNYLFEGAINHNVNDLHYRESVENELLKMQNDHPEIFKMINNAIPIMDEDEVATIPTYPSGMKIEEKLSLSNAITVADKTLHNLPKLIKLMCERYMNQSPRESKEYALAREIISNIDSIMKEDKEDNHERIIMMLNSIMKSYETVVGKKPLIHEIKYILKNHKPVERYKNFKI